MTKSPLKYAGSKAKLIGEIKSRMPEDTTYIVEPFCGSAAYSFSQELPFVLSDLSPELMNFFDVISDRKLVRSLLNKLSDYVLSHDKDNYKKIVNWDRCPEFDSLSDLNKISRAARYVYIIYFGFNGLYRVNKVGNGQCNTPYGGDNRKLPEGYDKILRAACRHLSKFCQVRSVREFDDFSSIIHLRDNHQKLFVLLDPPYANGDSEKGAGKRKVFQEYTTTKIDLVFFERLRNMMRNLNQYSVPFLMTNTDCEFIKDYFKEFTIEKVATSYSIGANKERTGSKFEYFITNS